MKIAKILPAALALLCPGLAYADAPSASVQQAADRAAQGDITQPGGARRLRGEQTEALKASLSAKRPKNIILFIGDGMGDSEITSARNYAKGAGGYFEGLDSLPITGQYTHYSLDKATGKPDYVTDSAASATAWAVGAKSYNGAIGVDIKGQPLPNLLELAKKAGKATGDVSTAAITDATPAAQIAHVTFRKCEGPEETSKHCPKNALENGGQGSIAEQFLQTRPDVTLGGGDKYFQQTSKGGKNKGKTVRAQAEALGYNIINSRESLNQVETANQQKPLLGLFAEKNMPLRWLGPKAVYHGNFKAFPDDKNAQKQTAVKCADNPLYNKSAPTLAAMTEKAISLLKGKPEGFFLQVESASIDKQNHEATPCGQIGEVVVLDEAVQKALEFARADGNTLVVVTADHAHSSQIVDNAVPVPGLAQTLITADGALMTMSYATGENTYQRHSGTQLRIAAYGPRAANVSGLTDQTDLFYTIRDSFGESSSGAGSPANAAASE